MDPASAHTERSPATPAAAADAPAPVPETISSVLKRLGPAGPLAIVAATLPAIGGFALLGTLNYVGPWLHSHQSSGVAIYIVGFALLAGFAVLPTYAQAILGGWAFGFAIGFPAALCGFLGAALIGYGVARRAAGDRVLKLISEHAQWQAVYDELLRSGFWKTLLIVTLLRLAPNSPFAITNLVLAVTRVPVGTYALGTLLGMAPRTGIAVFMAAGLKELVLDRRENTWLVVGGIVITLIVFAVIGLLANHAIQKVTRRPALASATAPQHGAP